LELAPEESLDDAFLAGIKEELASIEESEKNIQALSQVFRYYARHAKQLSLLLVDWAKQCFPWELIHAMHLVDDILLMDNTGRYKTELADRVQPVAVNTFKKAQSEQEKREVVRMLHAWQELRIFDPAMLDAVRGAIRTSGEAAASLLDEPVHMDDDDEAAPSAPTLASPVSPRLAVKRPRVSETPPKPGVSDAAAAQRVLSVVDRILATPGDRPFQMLGLDPTAETKGHDIRKAYRRLALLIHPDKNPGLEARCSEALIRLQQGREQAEADATKLDGDSARGETRCDATTNAASSAVDSGFRCRYPGCDLPPCKQCANACCTRNITHCHNIARQKAGMQCYFHPPPRAWARNAP